LALAAIIPAWWAMYAADKASAKAQAAVSVVAEERAAGKEAYEVLAERSNKGEAERRRLALEVAIAREIASKSAVGAGPVLASTVGPSVAEARDEIRRPETIPTARPAPAPERVEEAKAQIEAAAESL
jgi:hypothetical protein